MTNIVRFAPSPTGMLHIGGARTALFNYLFARSTSGKYLLRIEDTDKARSTKEAEQEILESLSWLGLSPDEEPLYQSASEERHIEVAKQLLASGKAYKCYATKEELQQLREEAQNNNQRFKYDRRWRERDEVEAPQDVEPVIRIKAPLTGVTKFTDRVQGKITIKNEEQDDFIILRADGTPTYMLAVVVDDHDMGVTHIIRGDDHLTNAAKQILIYEALGWQVPEFVHIPLIYGADGKKMSKRHGATAVSEYKELGYLPEALRNYLLRLGFAHGDAEIISDAQAIEWFNLEALGKSPARFDFKKLDNLNAHYFRETPDSELIEYIDKHYGGLDPEEQRRMQALLAELKNRATNYESLASATKFLRLDFKIENLEDKAAKQLQESNIYAEKIIAHLENQQDFTHQALYESCKVFAEEAEIKFKQVAAFIRIGLTGSHISPSIFEIMEVLGKDEVLRRLRAVLSFK